MTSSTHDQWLTRSVENRLSGPVSKAELCRRIQAGELGPQDEVCRASHYWISLHEQQEVLDQLGIRPQFQKAAASAQEEITETQTEVNDTEIRDGDIPDLPSEADLAGTAVIKRAKKNSTIQPVAPSGPLKVSVRGISRVERPSIWRGAAWALVLMAGVLIYSVLKILRT